MKRVFLALTLVLCAVPPVLGQTVVSRGMVEEINLEAGTMLVRKALARQLIHVAPDAELLVDGRPGVLEDIRYNAWVDLRGDRDRAGRLVATRLLVNQPALPTRLAANQPGGVITGEVAGFDPNRGMVYLRTRTGFRAVALGTSPILLDGRPVPLLELALGDRLQVRTEPISGGRGTAPALAVVLTPQRVAGVRQTFRQQELGSLSMPWWYVPFTPEAATAPQPETPEAE